MAEDEKNTKSPKDEKKYKAEKNSKQNSSNQDSSKKAAKVGAKAAANYFTGGKGGKVVDALSKTKTGDAILNKGASALNKIPGMAKATKKLDNSGALDKADKAMGASSLKGKNNQNTQSQSNQEDNGNQDDEEKGEEKKKNSPFGSSLKNKMKNGLKNTLLGKEDEDEEEDSGDSEHKVKLPDFKSVVTFFIKHPSLFVPFCIVILVVFVVFLFYFSVVSYQANEESKNQGGNAGNAAICSSISLNSTSLSKTDFKQRLLAKAQSSSSIGYKTFAQNADTIYDLSVKNNINPEMVVIRAAVEGFSPGVSKNNYWGLGCTNSGGYNACLSYSSFSGGVLGFIKNISQYSTVEDMMSRYAYIGSNWFSPGSSSAGGCYYYPYIKKYLSSQRASQVDRACSRSCSGSSCMKTNEEDQKAYTSYQVESMINMRSNIFGIGQDNCESSEKVAGSGSGSDVASYAVQTYDSFSYSQAMRMSANYVDCSSMVWRAYKKFGLSIGNANYAPVAADQYKWCESSKKTVSEQELQPGDLIFFSRGHYNAGRYKGIGHVSIYIGNSRHFAAHSARYAQPDQVSVTTYSKGTGDYFCRPYK